MKKIVIGLLPILMLSTGCSQKNNDRQTNRSESSETSVKNVDIRKKEDKKEEVKEEVTFYSDLEQKFFVSLPVGWQTYENPEELMEGGNLSFHKDESGFGNIAISEAVDYESFQQFMDQSKEAFELPSDDKVMQEEVEFGSFKGTRYIFSENVDGMNIKYAIYILENGIEFIEGQLWSQESKFDTYFNEGDSVFKTLSKE